VPVTTFSYSFQMCVQSDKRPTCEDQLIFRVRCTQVPRQMLYASRALVSERHIAELSLALPATTPETRCSLGGASILGNGSQVSVFSPMAYLLNSTCYLVTLKMFVWGKCQNNHCVQRGVFSRLCNITWNCYLNNACRNAIVCPNVIPVLEMEPFTWLCDIIVQMCITFRLWYNEDWFSMVAPGVGCSNFGASFP